MGGQRKTEVSLQQGEVGRQEKPLLPKMLHDDFSLSVCLSLIRVPLWLSQVMVSMIPQP